MLCDHRKGRVEKRIKSCLKKKLESFHEQEKKRSTIGQLTPNSGKHFSQVLCMANKPGANKAGSLETSYTAKLDGCYGNNPLKKKGLILLSSPLSG